MPQVSQQSSVLADDIDLDDIKTLEAFVEKHPDITNEARARWWIYNRQTNGLEASGALIKRAGRWFVVVPRLKAWLLGNPVDAP